MHLDFFPSRTLTFYLAKLFFSRIFAVLFMLVLVLLLLDLLGESGDILAHPGNGDATLWLYARLRVPQLIARFLPYSVLLATIITLVGLNQNSEIIAMKASGLSAHQILAPLILTAFVISCVNLAFNERVVTRASATLSAWQAVEYGPVPKSASVRTNVYVADGHNILSAASVEGEGAQMTLKDVTYYKRDNADNIVSVTWGKGAVYANPGWRLDGVTTFDVSDARGQSVPASSPDSVIARKITPDEVAISKVSADNESVFKLRRSIHALKGAGRPTEELKSAWWHKISGPFSAVLMPLLGAVAAFGLARSGQLLVRSVLGMALGFVFFVVDNAAMAMGNFGAYPPFLAAWGPFLLFALIGEMVLIRTEE